MNAQQSVNGWLIRSREIYANHNYRVDTARTRRSITYAQYF